MTKTNEKVMRNIGDLKVGLFGSLDLNKVRNTTKNETTD